MITKEKIDIYIRYKGNSDYWSKASSMNDVRKMSDKDWLLIERLTQDLALLASGMVSNELRQIIEKNVAKHTESEEVVNFLRNNNAMFLRNDSSVVLKFFKRLFK